MKRVTNTESAGTCRQSSSSGSGTRWGRRGEAHRRSREGGKWEEAFRWRAWDTPAPALCGARPSWASQPSLRGCGAELLGTKSPEDGPRGVRYGSSTHLAVHAARVFEDRPQAGHALGAGILVPAGSVRRVLQRLCAHNADVFHCGRRRWCWPVRPGFGSPGRVPPAKVQAVGLSRAAVLPAAAAARGRWGPCLLPHCSRKATASWASERVGGCKRTGGHVPAASGRPVGSRPAAAASTPRLPMDRSAPAQPGTDSWLEAELPRRHTACLREDSRAHSPCARGLAQRECSKRSDGRAGHVIAGPRSPLCRQRLC